MLQEDYYQKFSKTAIYKTDYRAGEISGLHIDSSARISFVTRGKLKEKAGKTEEWAQTGSWVIKPGDVLHKNEYGDQGTRIISVIFQNEGNESLLGNYLSSWKWHHGTAGIQAVCQFLNDLEEVEEEADLLEILYDFFSRQQFPKDSGERHLPGWLERIKEQINDEFAEQIMTSDLAKTVGVHPVYLARLFRKFYGQSVKEYLLDRRLSNALHQLSTSSLPLAQIAYSNGFSDQSHFHRQLKRKTNCTPGQLRNLFTST